MTACKDNKVYQIVESQKQDYINSGYDIYDDSGNIISYGKGKSVPYDEYMALKQELERIKAENEEALKKNVGTKKDPGKKQNDKEDAKHESENVNTGVE